MAFALRAFPGALRRPSILPKQPGGCLECLPLFLRQGDAESGKTLLRAENKSRTPLSARSRRGDEPRRETQTADTGWEGSRYREAGSLPKMSRLRPGQDARSWAADLGAAKGRDATTFPRICGAH